MHRIEVTPAAAPNRAVLLEDGNQPLGDSVTIVTRLGPTPIISVFDMDIDGNAETVGAQTVGAGNFTPIKSFLKSTSERIRPASFVGGIIRL